MPMPTRQQARLLENDPLRPLSPAMAEGDEVAPTAAQFADLLARFAELKSSVSPSPPHAAAIEPRHVPYAPLRTPAFSGSTNPETFINDLERHYRLNPAFFASANDPRRVDEARTALVGPAALWFDNLSASSPALLSSYSSFLTEFRRVYLSAQGLDNPFDNLRSLRMTGPMQEFVAEFNARLARCPPPVLEQSSISDFRRALPASLASELERSRVTRFGGRTEWPSLAEIQSAAAALASARRSIPPPPPVVAAAVASSLAPSSASPSYAPSYASTAAFPPLSVSSTAPSQSSAPPLSAATSPIPYQTPVEIARRRAIADEREKRGECRYCGSKDHKVASCPLVEAKERKGKA